MDMALIDLAARSLITAEEAQTKSMTPNLFGQANTTGHMTMRR